MSSLKLDEIGYWSEVKLEIVRKYAKAYSTILATKRGWQHFYIDGFAGSGVHISKKSGEFVLGSPLNALEITPPFREHYLIDLNSKKTEMLRKLVEERKLSNVHIYSGDCNKILLEQVFPLVKYAEFKRALCLLDPYGLHLDWKVIHTAGQMKTFDIFLNFPIMDINMNVLKRDPQAVDSAQAKRMDTFWGDRSWRDAAYRKEIDLFDTEWEEKNRNEAVAAAFKKRLKKEAGFDYVAEPMPMRNKRGAVVYYLFFASQKPVAADIVKDIFDKYRNKGVV